MYIHELLSHSAQAHPDCIAVRHEDRQMTFAQLEAAAKKLAAFLVRSGFAPGDRAALLCDNSPEYLVQFFGASKAGLILVPLDTSLPPDSLAAILSDCQAEVLLTDSKFRRKLSVLLASAPSVKLAIAENPLTVSDHQIAGLSDIVETESPCHNKPELPSVSGGDASLAAIFYTSGSTGAGKGVMLSHRNLVSNTLATIEYLKLTADDSVLVVLPFHYIYGNSLLLTHIATGGRLVLDNRFLYPEAILDTMEQEGVTGFSGVPSNFQILLGKSTFASRAFPRLRYLTQAGGAMAPETIRRLMTVCSGKEIYIMYGQTEASPRVSYLPPERLADKVGSVGIPVPGVQILVVDEQDREVPVGETGEVVVIGDNVMLGYWNQPAEDAQVLRNGRLYTGDLGRKDAEGFLYIVGRRKEIIKAGGNRVSVKEVEDCLLAHQSVLEATVFGVDDPILVEAAKAVIVLKPDHAATAAELTQHCRQRLADYKVPKHISFADSLPKYQSGKVNKVLLKREHAGSRQS